MKLLIDAGNTRIKWALVDGGNDWLRSGVLPVGQASGLPGLFAGSQDIQQIWVSNVAGEEVAQHIRNIGAGQPAQLHFIVAQETQCGVRNGYSRAAQLGSDRWAALIAAWQLVQGKCLVVNCGTAITIDALSGQGKFLGGLILPGVELMQRSLAGATAQLKSGHVKMEQGKYVQFPLNTSDALYSGAIQAGCGAIQRQHALLVDDDAPVVLSGGAAGVLREHLQHVTGEASRLREEVRCGHSRTRGLRPTVSWTHLNLPLHVVDNLVLQGLLLISQVSNA
ncbi:MAG: type III pantothenate kinase [Gallionella sp.]|nr:type III pantothenate kinase [Gallionella sp.]